MMPLLYFTSAITAWTAMAALYSRSTNERRRMGLPDQTPGRSLACALAGVTLLFVSVVAAVAACGTSFGIVLWLCQAGLLGLLMVCLLPYAGTAVLAPWRCLRKGWPHGGQ